MSCPFLREMQVKYCQTSAFRKLIPLAQTGRADEKCSSAEHVSCPVFRGQMENDPVSGTCPYLRESLMQYCGAAPVAKLVPYSESLLSRCGNDNFRYCQLYLAMAHPSVDAEEADRAPMPGQLKYSANHMWIDATEDGVCHVGIDAFLSRVLGKVERVSYVWLNGRHRPTAVLTVEGVDLEVVFPNPLLLTNCNLYLRADPSPLTSQPYTAGWLFEGVLEPGALDKLFEGAAARAWMEREQHRINEFLQQQLCQPTAADGGQFVAGLARLLDRGQLRALFHSFFSPGASEERES
jgi:glycine cleavage system H lipoate-binding protein